MPNPELCGLWRIPNYEFLIAIDDVAFGSIRMHVVNEEYGSYGIVTFKGHMVTNDNSPTDAMTAILELQILMKEYKKTINSSSLAMIWNEIGWVSIDEKMYIPLISVMPYHPYVFGISDVRIGRPNTHLHIAGFLKSFDNQVHRQGVTG